MKAPEKSGAFHCTPINIRMKNEIRAIVIIDDDETYKKGDLLFGERALPLVVQGIAKLVEEKRDTRSRKKVATR